MAVAHVTSSQSHASASFSVSQTAFNWTHTTSTDPQGVLILVFQGVSATDAVVAVDYDGTTVPAVSGGRATDTATEPGSVAAYFLGSGIPTTNNPTVTVSRTNNTTTMWAVCITVTAATNTEVAGTVLLQENGAFAVQSVDDGSTGVDSVRYAGAYYGGSSPAPAGTGSTLLGTTNDAGLYGWSAVRETTAGQGARNVGFTQATSDDRAGVHLAVREVYVPPGPTITAFETSDWTGTGTPKTITVTGALNGDKIVVLYGGDNGTGGTDVSAATVTTTGGSTGTWTEPEEGLAASSQCWASSSEADVTADGTVTVSLARTQSTGKEWGGVALLCHNHGGVGVHARSAPSATETASLAVSQDSAVGMVAFDWDDFATVAFTPSGALEVQRSQDPNITVYAAYWLGQAAGTRGYGIATSSTTNLHIIAVEILAATSGVTGAASAAFGFTATAAGIDRALGLAAASFGFTGTAAGVDRALGAATGSFGFTATASGQAGNPPVTGAATGLFGFTATALGIPRVRGSAGASLGFTAIAAGIDRALGTALASFGFTATAQGRPRTFGVAVATFGFTATTAGTPRVHGLAAGSFGFTATAQGFAGSPPVTGQATSLFGFTGTAAGQPRTLGAGVAAFGFTSTANGRPRVVGVAVAGLGFTGATSGKIRVFAIAAAPFGFTALVDGMGTPPYIPLTDPVTAVRHNPAAVRSRTNPAAAGGRPNPAVAASGPNPAEATT